MAKTVPSFEHLEVYQLALSLQQDVFVISKSFPKDEIYSLTNQIRRSSRSIGGNIGEAWAKRRYPAHFISKLSDSDGEQNETRHWLKTAYLCEYIENQEYENLMERCQMIGRMLGHMIQHHEEWLPRQCR